MTSPVDRTVVETQRRRKISWEEFYTHLYGHRDIQTVDPDELRIKRARSISRESDGETEGTTIGSLSIYWVGRGGMGR